MKKRLRKRLVRIIGKTERMRDSLKGKSILCFISVFFVSAILALPLPFIGSSNTIRRMDYMLDDLIYQHNQKEINPNIVVVKITADDITANGGAEKLPEVVLSLCEELNRDISNSPFVIAIDTDLMDCANPLGKTYFTGLKSENIVVGVNGVSKNISYTDDTLFSENPEILIDDSLSYTNLFFDIDGKIRHYAYSSEYKGKSADSFAKKVIETYQKNSNQSVYTVRLSDHNSMPITYMHRLDDYSCCTLGELLDGRVSSDILSGKIIMIGVDDDTLGGGFFTAHSNVDVSSNLEIQTNVIDSVLSGSCRQDIPILFQNIFLWLISAIMIALIIYMKHAITWLFFAVMTVGTLAGGILLWNGGFVFHPMRCIISLIFIAFIAVVRFLVNAQYRSDKLNSMISHYVDKNIIEELSNNQEDADLLHGSTKKVAVMFADIRNFTNMSEYVGADESVEILNNILAVAADCIMASGGTLDKYIGDCIMAFWGAPKDCEDSAYIACKTALEMAERVKPLCDDIAEKYNRALAFGIGINYGEAVVGNIGCEDRMDYTAIGDTVNLASRLEEDAPGGSIYVSESVYKELHGRGRCRMLSNTIRIKGKINPVTVYSLDALSDSGSKAANVEIKKVSDYYFNVKFFGTRGSYSISGARYKEFGGHTTCMILKKDDYAIIVDCGTGLYMAQDYLKDCKHIDVLFSHMHYDHILGLLNFSVFPKECEVRFYGTFSEWKNGKVFDELFADPFWPVNPGFNNLVDVQREQRYTLYDGTNVSFFEAPHPNHASLICIETPTKKRICVMVDCENPEGLPFAKVSGADLLVYDGMFAPDDYEVHRGYGHSTYKAGCSLASLARVKYLIITHHNPAYSDSKLLEMEKEAKLLYPDMSFARDDAEYVL